MQVRQKYETKTVKLVLSLNLLYEFDDKENTVSWFSYHAISIPQFRACITKTGNRYSCDNKTMTYYPLTIKERLLLQFNFS